MIEYLKGLIKDFPVGVKIEKDDSCLQEAFYETGSNTIFVNETLISKAAAENGLEKREYLTIVFFHELGHSLDIDLEELGKRIIEAKQFIYQNGYNKVWFDKYAFASYRAEENAWKIAKQMINEKHSENFERVKNKSLKEHKAILKTEEKVIKLDHQSPLFHE